LTLHEALASSKYLNEVTVMSLRRRREATIDQILAGNPALSEEAIVDFLERDDRELDRGLASNPALGNDAFERLLKKDAQITEILLARQAIDLERWEIIQRHLPPEKLPIEIAANPRMTEEVFETLFEHVMPELRRKLASNPSIPRRLRHILLDEGGEMLVELAGNFSLESDEIERITDRLITLETGIVTAVERALAGNPATEVERLEAFYKSGREDLLEALAGNPSTPMEILHQLKLDFRLFPIVSHNPTFIERANFEMGMR